jgi:predicted acylesterase/phospholipase RssA
MVSTVVLEIYVHTTALISACAIGMRRKLRQIAIVLFDSERRSPRLRLGPEEGGNSRGLRRLRLLLAVLFIYPVCPLALQACADLAVAESTAPVDRQPLANVPMTIRTLDASHQFSQVSTMIVAGRLRALHPGEPLNILVLSGGGADGAFGAGAVAGLTRSGSRPDFAVVTGVSVGALVAPYAFLGPAWDPGLLEVFTSGAGDNLLQSRGLGVIFGSSLYRGKPLRQLVDAYLSDTMIQAIARESDKGRLLLVATTDVVTGMPVVWDLGAIAKNGGPSARTLFRDVLVASASVPGMFPPVMIRVNRDGAPHDEAHVDGSATVPFFVPPAFMQTPPEARDGANRTAVYVIINGSLGEAPQATRLTTRAILTRSIHAGLNHMLLTTLELTAANTQLQGATLQYSAVPGAHTRGGAYDFRADTMRPLFRYAYECAQAGRLWTSFGRTDDGSGTSPGITETQEVPCPADDASIRYFAAR